MKVKAKRRKYFPIMKAFWTTKEKKIAFFDTDTIMKKGPLHTSVTFMNRRFLMIISSKLCSLLLLTYDSEKNCTLKY